MKLLPLLVAWFQTGIPASLPAHGAVIPIEQMAAGNEQGTCSGPAGDVDFRRIMFLENASLVVDAPAGPIRLSIDGESLIAAELAEKSEHREYFSNIDSLVNPDEDLDLLLKFAHDGKHLLLYWRETFRNRIYRQGIMKVNPAEFFKPSNEVLTVVCEGHGGKHSEP